MKSHSRCLLVLILLFSFLAAAAAAAESIATLTGVNAPCEVSPGGSADWKPATLKQQLNAGDSVRTGSGGYAVILFTNGTVIKLDQDSIFNISAGEDSGEVDLELELGALWDRTTNALGDDGTLEIGTPSGVIAVRGTEFVIRVGAEKTTTVVVVEGAANFSNQYGSVVVNQSEMSKAAPGSAPSMPEKVDTIHWIKWTFDVREMGMSIETPLVSQDREELAKLEAEYKKQAAEEKSAAAFTGLGNVYYDSGKLEEARTAFNSAIDMDAADGAAVFGLGMTLVAMGLPDDAIRLFEKSGVPEMSFGLGVAYLKKQDLENAGKAFSAALEKKQDHALAYVGLGVLAARSGDLEKAADLLSMAVKFNPKLSQAKAKLALVYFAQNRNAEALEAAQAAVALAPSSPSSHTSLSRILFFSDRLGEAREHATTALSLNPYDSAAHDILSRLFILENKIDSALRESLMGVALDPDNPYARDALGLAYKIYMKYSGAVLQWEKAIELDPSFVRARLRLAELYNELGRPADAEKHLLAALEYDPENDEVVGELGRSYELQKNFSAAEESYLKATALNPNRALHHSRLGSFYIERYEINPALEHARLAVALEPTHPFNQYILGMVYDALDHADGAMRCYEEALRLDPNYSLARYKLGVIYGNEGRAQAGVHEMHSSVLHDPRVVSFAQYRGANRFTARVGEFNMRLAEAVLTGDAKETRLNYRLVGLFNETDGHRNVNGDSRLKGASLIAGYRSSYKNSVFFYAELSDTDSGTPLSASTDDPDDRVTFRTGNLELAWQREIGPKTAMSVRAAKVAIEQEKTCPNNSGAVLLEQGCLSASAYDDYKVPRDELEIRIDRRYRKHRFILGGFVAESKLKRQLISPNVYGAQDRTQKNLYAEGNLAIGKRLQVTYGMENSFHNTLGSEVSRKLLLEYQPSARTSLRFLSRDPFRLPYYPKYHPVEAWAVVADSDLTSDAQRGMFHEIDVTHQFRDTTLAKVAAFAEDIDNYSTGMDSVEKTGVRFTLEKKIGANTLMFANHTAAHFYDSTPGGAFADNSVPGFPRKVTGFGLFHSPAKDWQARLYATRNSKSFADNANTRTIDDYFLVNFQLKFEPRIDRSYFINISNIFNEAYEITEDYPEAGRAISAGIRLWF